MVQSPSTDQPVALIVDDDPMQSRLLQAGLQKLGVRSEAVATSHEFISRLKPLQPTLCFVDLNIERPGIGYTILAAVRKTLGGAPVLIAYSGLTSAASIAHALECGADDFLGKPLDWKQLIEKVSNYVNTEQIELNKKPETALNPHAEAKLELAFSLRRIDELGVRLVSRHLINKGVAIRLGGELIVKATGRANGVLMTVTSNNAREDKTYELTAEFDEADSELRGTLRNWLSVRK